MELEWWEWLLYIGQGLWTLFLTMGVIMNVVDEWRHM